MTRDAEKTPQEAVRDFLAADRFAVVGASLDAEKFGSKILARYLEHGKDVVPIHPKEASLQGVKAYPNLRELPKPPQSVSIVTPPAVTEKVVEDAIAAGAKSVWMQPGAESEAAVARAKEAGLDVISGGPCVLVMLGPKR